MCRLVRVLGAWGGRGRACKRGLGLRPQELCSKDGPLGKTKDCVALGDSLGVLSREMMDRIATCDAATSSMESWIQLWTQMASNFSAAPLSTDSQTGHAGLSMFNTIVEEFLAMKAAKSNPVLEISKPDVLTSTSATDAYYNDTDHDQEAKARAAIEAAEPLKLQQAPDVVAIMQVYEYKGDSEKAICVSCNRCYFRLFRPKVFFLFRYRLFMSGSFS